MQELDGHNLDLHHSGLGSKTYANHDGYVFLWYHLAIRLGLPLTPLLCSPRIPKQAIHPITMIDTQCVSMAQSVRLLVGTTTIMIR
jgi:hypothetical protein